MCAALFWRTDKEVNRDLSRLRKVFYFMVKACNSRVFLVKIKYKLSAGVTGIEAKVEEPVFCLFFV